MSLSSTFADYSPPLPRLAVALLLGALAATAATLSAPASADACTWAPGDIRHQVPQPETDIPPTAEFSIWFNPGITAELDFELHGPDDDSIDTETERIRISERSVDEWDHRRIIPQSLLDVGQHTLTVSTVEEDAHGVPLTDEDGEPTDEVTMKFTVVDQAPSPPEDFDEIDWVRTDVSDEFGDTCFSSDRRQWHEVEIKTQNFSAPLWYEIHYEGTDETTVASQPDPDAVRHHINHDADCIGVEAVGVDGVRSALFETCSPDLCQLQTSPGETDEIDCSTDDSSDGSDESSDSDAEQEPGDRPACATGSGAGTPLSLLVALMVFAVGRRFYSETSHRTSNGTPVNAGKNTSATP